MHQITAFGGMEGPVPFQQAIVQSPGFQPMPSATGQEAVFQEFLTKAGVSTLQEARAMSSEALQLANYKVVGESYPYGTFTFNPVVDGKFAPALPGQLLLHGAYDTSIKIMAGHNLYEGYEFMDPFAQNETSFDANWRIYFPTITDATVQYLSQTLYPPNFNGSAGYTSFTFRSELWVTEAFFTCNTNWLANAFGGQAFNYIFSVPPSLHGDDIVYTYFDGQNGPLVYPNVQNDTLAVMMQEYFTNFVTYGDPNGPRLPQFPMYGTNATVLNLNLTEIFPVPDNAANPRCDWWQKGLYA